MARWTWARQPFAQLTGDGSLSLGAPTCNRVDANWLNCLSRITRAFIYCTLSVIPQAHAQTEPQIRRAAQRALKPIEQSIAGYIKQRACFSCHHNGLGLMALREARNHGVSADPQLISDLEKKTFRTLTGDHALTTAIEASDLSDPTPNDSLLLLATIGSSVGVSTDISAIHKERLARWQHPDGHWATSDFRPPHSSSVFAATETAVEALRGEAYSSVRTRALQWFLTNKANSTEDAAFKLLGLKYTEAPREDITRAAADLATRQLQNGGWAQLPGYPADAYSTGEAVYALIQAQANPTRQRTGLRFLIANQAPDGTWRTRTRMLSPAHVSPPYFKTGFPYGKGEFISFAGSCWALRALTASLPFQSGSGSGVGGSKVPILQTVLFGSLSALQHYEGHKISLDDSDGGLDYKTPDGVTLLMAAAPDEAKVRLLLSWGADAKARSKSGADALTIASGYRDNAGTLAALLDAGAEPNLPADSKVRNSPLVLASMSGDLAMVKLLLAHGADPSASSRSNTPISAAATFGHADVVQALIDAGASVDLAESTGINLLHWAAITNRPQLVPILKKAGVPINAMDDNGFTPLHYAASIDFGEKRMVEALLAAGANRKLRDFDERTPLQQALRLNHQALAKALAEPRAPASAASPKTAKPASSKPSAATR